MVVIPQFQHSWLCECHRAFDSCLRHADAHGVDLVTHSGTLLIPDQILSTQENTLYPADFLKFC